MMVERKSTGDVCSNDKGKKKGLAKNADVAFGLLR
jgi:hypothetical protein